MTKLIIDLHALKTHLELQGNWFLAKQVALQIEEKTKHLCRFCCKPVDGPLKDHEDCVSLCQEAA